jgi:hypothetical protein
LPPGAERNGGIQRGPRHQVALIVVIEPLCASRFQRRFRAVSAPVGIVVSTRTGATTPYLAHPIVQEE